MAEQNLSGTSYERPDCCAGCKHYANADLDSRFCPTNVALNTLGRIKDVINGYYDLDSTEDADNLVDQLPRLSTAAAQCGRLLAQGRIEEPYHVTTDLSLTNFTVHSPTEFIPARVIPI